MAIKIGKADEPTSSTGNPWHELANAVILQAVIDYREALRDHNDYLIHDCERFFKSKWGAALSGDLSLAYVQEKIGCGVREFIRTAREAGESVKVFECPICGDTVTRKYISPVTYYQPRYGHDVTRSGWVEAGCNGCGFKYKRYFD